MVFLCIIWYAATAKEYHSSQVGHWRVWDIALQTILYSYTPCPKKYFFAPTAQLELWVESIFQINAYIPPALHSCIWISSGGMIFSLEWVWWDIFVEQIGVTSVKNIRNFGGKWKHFSPPVTADNWPNSKNGRLVLPCRSIMSTLSNFTPIY